MLRNVARGARSRSDSTPCVHPLVQHSVRAPQVAVCRLLAPDQFHIVHVRESVARL
jgi:hypothetical protein